MSVKEQREFDKTAVDFQNGLQLVAMLGDWTRIEMNREAIPSAITAFKHAYAEMLKRQRAGHLNMGNVLLSDTGLAAVSRIEEILEHGLHADDTHRQLEELHELVVRSMEAFASTAIHAKE